MNFPFTPSPDDQSIYYLGKIFGNVPAVLTGITTDAGATGIGILGSMFSAFNTVILGVGTIIVLYVTVVGVMKTAHEGEFLGKQWNNIWIPIRMVIGIAALVPTTTGYSSIQILVMWIIVQGVGAADYVWGRALGFTDKLGSPLSTLTIPAVGIGANMQNLFQGLVCQESARAKFVYPPQANTPGFYSLEAGYYCASASGQGDPFCGLSQDAGGLWDIKNPTQSSTSQSSYTMDTTKSGDNKTVSGTQTLYTYNLGPSGKCGTMTFCGDDTACNDTSDVTNQIRCNACKAQGEALQAIVSVMSNIAKQFVQADYDWRVFLTTNAGATQQGVPDWIQSFCSSIGATEPGTCCRAGDTAHKCKINASYTTGSDAVNAEPDTITNVLWPFYIKTQVSGDINFISASTSNYVAALQKVATDAIDQAAPTFTSSNSDWLTEAYNVGWIFAGSYYYKLAKGNNNNVSASLPPWNVNATNPKPDPGNFLSKYRNNFDAASTLVNQVASQTSNQAAGSSNFSMSLSPQLKDLNKLSDGLKSGGDGVMDNFYSMVTGAKAGEVATNPLLQLQTLGKWLLIIAQVIFALIMVVIPTLLLLGYFFPSALGNFVTNPVGPTVSSIILMFTPLFAVFVGALFTFGALLAVYTPLIPYVVYTMGAIAWFILVIEAMVAAPIVALGILSPSGGEILGKAEHALMYLLSIFLRPTLMVFGLMAAMLLSVVVVTMINAAFSGVMGQIYSNPGLVEIILFLGAYVGLVLAALNKCFALIHIIPDQALRWIGGHGETLGGAAAGEGISGAKGGVSAAGAEAHGVGKGMAKKGEDTEKALKAKLAKKMGGGAPPTVTPNPPPP